MGWGALLATNEKSSNARKESKIGNRVRGPKGFNFSGIQELIRNSRMPINPHARSELEKHQRTFFRDV